MESPTTVIPAIDLREGKCVRLVQGDYERQKVFGSDPAGTARLWADQGAELIHVVDLDGARLGHPTQVEVVESIVKAVEIPVELGGGLRTANAVEDVIGLGVSRAILGSAALHDIDLVRDLASRFPARIVVSIDARDGKVRGSGWLEGSEIDALELAKQLDGIGLAAIVFTDIAKDGMMSGPNLQAVERVLGAVRTPIIASGGVGSLADIRSLAGLGAPGIIVGRALYEGRFTLAEAITAARQTGSTA